MSKGDNQDEVDLDDHAMVDLLKVENSSKIDPEYNEGQVFDECPQRVESEVLLELHSIQNSNTTEIDIVNSYLDSQLYVLAIEDTIPKLLGLNDLFGAYNFTIHLACAPWSISTEVLSFLFKCMGHKLDMDLGDELFDIKLERDVTNMFCLHRYSETSIECGILDGSCLCISLLCILVPFVQFLPFQYINMIIVI
ncbi:putative protein isoform X2 [Capsicum chacoense]